jgi:excisionase family DNA binding protein
MLTAEEAAAVSSLSTRAIYRLIEAGRLHFAEPPGSPLLVCFNSLRRR